MPNIIFPDRDFSSEQLSVSSTELSTLSRFNTLHLANMQANMPYCMAPHPQGRPITQSLSTLSPRSRQTLLHTVDTFGDQTSALADIYDRHLAGLELKGAGSVTGATAGAIEGHLTELQKALRKYQESLIALNNHKANGRRGMAGKTELTNLVRRRYNTLQTQFQLELKRRVPVEHIGKNRGSALTSAERGITLANRRRSRHLYVADGGQADRLGRLVKGTRFVGNSMVLLDAGLRAQGVRDTYRDGGDWQREAVVQTTGLGFGTAVGALSGKAVVGGLLMIGLGATPVGWVVLITAGVGTGLAVGSAGDWLGKASARWVYDRGF